MLTERERAMMEAPQGFQESAEEPSELSEVLAAMEKEVEEQKAAEAPPVAMQDSLRMALAELKDGPSEEDILRWKQEHGEHRVHLFAMNSEEMYVFTILKRRDYRQIQKLMQQVEGTDMEEKLMQQVLQASMLHPAPLPPTFFYNSPAGLIETLYQLIMAHSGFLTLQQAMAITVTL